MATRRDFLQRAFWATFALTATPLPLLAAADDTHTVRRGETLSAIARQHGVSVQALKRQNRLRNDLIRPGQRLSIPRPASGGAVLAPVIAATRNIRVDTDRWRYIVAHHSAVEAGNARTYGAEHTRRGYEHGLGYHFVIGNGRDSGDGEIEVGSRWIKQVRGGHVRSQEVNETGIGVCLVGNFENHPPSSRQMASLTALIDWLREGRVSSRCRFSVHRWVDRNHTLCPGRHFPYAMAKKRFA